MSQTDIYAFTCPLLKTVRVKNVSEKKSKALVRELSVNFNTLYGSKIHFLERSELVKSVRNFIGIHIKKEQREGTFIKEVPLGWYPNVLIHCIIHCYNPQFDIDNMSIWNKLGIDSLKDCKVIPEDNTNFITSVQLSCVKVLSKEDEMVMFKIKPFKLEI